MADSVCAICGTSDAAIARRCREPDCPVHARPPGARQSWSPVLVLLVIGLVAILGSVVGLALSVRHRPGTTVEIVDAAPRVAFKPAPRPLNPKPRQAAPTQAPAPVAFVPETTEEPPAPRRSNGYDGVALGLFKPSFECQGARAAALILICYDPDLAVLDRESDAHFERVLAKSASKDELRRRYDIWRRQLAALPAEYLVLQAHYRRLKDQLDHPPPAAMASSPAASPRPE